MSSNPLSLIPVATILILILAIAGAVVVIINPHSLTFDQYIKDIGTAAGILGVGRGLDHIAHP